MATRISFAAASAMALELATLLNGGTIDLLTGVSAAGGQPSDVEDGTALGTRLATFTLADPAFAAVTDAAPGASVSANGIAAVSALTSGTARWFRAYTSASVQVLDGAAGSATSGAELLLNNDDIDQDQTITINSWSITVPQSAA